MGNGSNVWQLEFGEGIPGWDIWEAEAPARMEDLLLLLVGTNPQQQPALLPTAETEESPGKQISLSKLPSSHGKRCCRRGWALWILPIQGMHSTGGERGEFTAVSRCGEAQIAKYLGKKITSVLVSFIPTQPFFLAPIHEPQTEGIWREGALALLRWHLGHVRMSFPLSNQSVIKWGEQGRERGGWQTAEHLAQKLLQQV